MADAEVPSQKYDQDFFLALAAKGKDAWNAWRRDPANKDARVTFAAIDFSEAPRDQIDFSGFDFGDDADFSECKWRGVAVARKDFEPGRASITAADVGKNANFASAAFGRRASFVGAGFGGAGYFTGVAFGANADFTGAIFGSLANFTGAAFGDQTNFTSAIFGGVAYFGVAVVGREANFTGARFRDQAYFEGVAFGEEANFTGASFGDSSSFDGAAFGWGSKFNDTIFARVVLFTGKPKEQWAMDYARVTGMDTEDFAKLKKRHEDSWTGFGSGPDRFLRISFVNARFNGEARFSGRSFERIADFTRAHFYYPPDFGETSNAGKIDFTGTHIGFAFPGKLLHWTEVSVIAVGLRAVRKVAEETKNHDLERDLYIEERKAERGVYLRQLFEELKKAPWTEWSRIAGRILAHVFWIAIIGVYWALADYGRSFVRPAAWLIASGYGFYRLYLWILAPKPSKVGPLDMEKYEHAVRVLALGNSVPFVGPLTLDAEIKKFLFCPNHDPTCLPLPPGGFQALVIAQNLFSITCVFFIGLALRNYFRIK